MNARPFAGRERAAARRGLTLLELLLVLMILGLIMGAGLGALATLDLESRETPGLIRNVLRSAQNTALARRTATRVRIDRAAGTLRAEALEPVGTWHFEDASLTGAFGLAGTLDDGGRIADDGYLGKCLSFLGGPVDARVEVPVPGEGRFDLREGFSFDLALNVEGSGAFRVLHVGEACGLDVLADGALRAWFSPALVAAGGGEREARGAAVMATTGPRMVPFGQWVQVRVEYDRLSLRVWVNGTPRARTEEQAPVWAVEGPLTLSDRGTRFDGSLDKLTIGAVLTGDLARLGEGQVFAGPTPDIVHFDAGGGLDRERHPAPLMIEVESADGRRDRVRVGLYGTVEDEL